MNKKIILASGSPRRRELLTQIGLQFEVRVSRADEKTAVRKPELMVQELAERKSSAVWEALLGEERDSVIVVGADTVVVLDGSIMGKPENEENAFEMLSWLQGRTHQVYTGVTVIGRTEGGSLHRKTFYEKTDVTMFAMKAQEIRDYIKTGEPMDKAGAYGIQGKCAAFIRGICGDYYNVVGLPIGRLCQELKLFN